MAMFLPVSSDCRPDCRLFNLAFPFPLLIANRKQANRSAIQANLTSSVGTRCLTFADCRLHLGLNSNLVSLNSYRASTRTIHSVHIITCTSHTYLIPFSSHELPPLNLKATRRARAGLENCNWFEIFKSRLVLVVKSKGP